MEDINENFETALEKVAEKGLSVNEFKKLSDSLRRSQTSIFQSQSPVHTPTRPNDTPQLEVYISPSFLYPQFREVKPINFAPKSNSPEVQTPHTVINNVLLRRNKKVSFPFISL